MLHRVAETYTMTSQQELEKLIESDMSSWLCAPTALFDTARALGHEINAEDYIASLDPEQYRIESGTWSRAGLSKILRSHGASIISWHLAKTGQTPTGEDITAMTAAGYIESTVEKDLLLTHVSKANSIASLLTELNLPVIVSVSGGFAHNTQTHAVTLEHFDASKDEYTITDPDERNTRTLYSREYVEAYLDQEGAASIILPNYLLAEQRASETAESARTISGAKLP